MNEDNKTMVKWLGGLSAIVGLWLVIAPFTLGFIATAAYWNQIVVGLVAIGLGLTQLSAPEVTWPSWTNLVAALWLAASPYLFPSGESAIYVNAVVSAIALAVLGLSGGLALRNASQEEWRAHHRPT